MAAAAGIEVGGRLRGHRHRWGRRVDGQHHLADVVGVVAGLQHGSETTSGLPSAGAVHVRLVGVAGEQHGELRAAAVDDRGERRATRPCSASSVGRRRSGRLRGTRRSSTWASPLAGSPSVSWSATRLTAATGSPMSIWVIPPGDTSVGVSEVTAPTTPTVTPWTTNVAYSGSAGVCVPFWYTLAPRYCHSALVPVPLVPATRARDRVAWPGRAADHPRRQVGVALVELVVADGRGVQAHLVHHVDRRLVLLDRRVEQRRADQVTGAEQQRARDRSARSFSIVVAHFVVRSLVGSIRPWKSLMFSSVIFTGAAWTTPAGASDHGSADGGQAGDGNGEPSAQLRSHRLDSLVTVAVRGT